MTVPTASSRPRVRADLADADRPAGRVTQPPGDLTGHQQTLLRRGVECLA